MRTSIIHSFILIFIGIVVLGYQELTYTTRERVIKQAQQAMKAETLGLSPIIGAIPLVGGIGLLIMVSRKNLRDAKQ
ncbi:MAG: DUF3185 domain-containing protein [Desulfamplus sp.]|nr:DUF3185 domain-containing protein [Desulfamplus sp.]